MNDLYILLIGFGFVVAMCVLEWRQLRRIDAHFAALRRRSDEGHAVRMLGIGLWHAGSLAGIEARCAGFGYRG